MDEPARGRVASQPMRSVGQSDSAVQVLMHDQRNRRARRELSIPHSLACRREPAFHFQAQLLRRSDHLEHGYRAYQQRCRRLLKPHPGYLQLLREGWRLEFSNSA